MFQNKEMIIDELKHIGQTIIDDAENLKEDPQKITGIQIVASINDLGETTIEYSITKYF